MHCIAFRVVQVWFYSEDSKTGSDPPTMASSSAPSTSRQLQIRLLSADPATSVPDTALSVPASVDPEGLNQLVHGLLREARGEGDYEEVGLAGRRFDFLLAEDFVRGSLSEALSSPAAVAKGLGEESLLDVHYVDSLPPPRPGREVSHDDWVGGVAVGNGHVLAACYDGTVTIFDAEGGDRRLTIPGHAGPAKSVAWISANEQEGGAWAEKKNGGECN